MGACPTRLIADSPAETDAFGSHERVAQAIADLVLNEEGGKSIALAGPWGSGKSTVIKFLAEKVRKHNNNCELFVFDAWAHQGDPLRRSFLEQLVSFLMNKKWLSSDVWQKEVEQLAGYRDETTIITEPVLTTLGTVFIILMFLTPVGYALLSKQGSLFWVGLALASIIPVAALVMITATAKCRKVSSEERINILGLLINKVREITKTYSFRTTNPTSIEFQKMFNRIMREALTGVRRLVVVIDNLDRIEASDALSVWATMRTFFEHDGNVREDWQSRFWLVVPFDPSGIARLWRRDGSDQNHDFESRQEKLSSSFIDKTFQVIFSVPRPVLSDWEAFLKQQLGNAFPSHNDESGQKDFHTIYRIYSSMGLKDGSPPTPRDIKLFVNAVGSLHRQWGDTISLPTQATYVLMRQREQDLIQQLLDPDSLSPSVKAVLGENYAQELAALHFNVPKEKALQVLMADRIRGALMKRDNRALAELSAVPGFWQVCEAVIESESQSWIQTDPVMLANCGYCFAELESQTESQRQVWYRLGSAILQLKTWPNLDEKVGQGLVQILEHWPGDTKKLTECLLESLGNSLPPEEDKEGEAKGLKDFISCIVTVLSKIVEKDFGNEILSRFSIDGRAETYLRVIEGLSSITVSPVIKKCFKPKAPLEDAMNALAQGFSGGTTYKSYSEMVITMTEIGPDWPWQSVANTISSRLMQPDIPLAEVNALMDALLHMRKVSDFEPSIKSIMDNLVHQGCLMHHLYRANNGGDSDCMASLLVPFFEFEPEGNLSSQWHSSSAGVEAYRRILTAPDQYDAVVSSVKRLIVELSASDIVLTALDRAPAYTRPFLHAVLRKMSQEEVETCITSQHIISGFSCLAEALDKQTLHHAISYSALNGFLLDQIIAEQFQLKLADLYLAVAKLENIDLSRFLTFLVDGIRKIDREQWLEELKQNGSVLDLVTYLIAKECPLDLSVHFQDALQDFARLLFNQSEEVPELHEESVSALVKALGREEKDTFLRNIRDLMLRNCDWSCNRFLNAYGDVLLEAGAILEEKADEIVRDAFRCMLDRCDAGEIAWARKVLEKTRIADQAKPESLKDFRKRLMDTRKQENIDSPVKGELDAIARLVRKTKSVQKGK